MINILLLLSHSLLCLLAVYDASQCGSLSQFYFELLGCIDQCFIKFSKFGAIISSNILFSPFSLSPLLLRLPLCVFRSLKHCSFFFIILTFCSSDWIISMDLFLGLLILFSACSSLLLSSCSEFFISIIVLSSVEFSFGYVVTASFCLSRLPIC